MRRRGRRGKAGGDRTGAQVGALGGACTVLRICMESGHLLFLIVCGLGHSTSEPVSPSLKWGS